MTSNITMMIILSLAALVAVAVLSHSPQAVRFNPNWIVAAGTMVQVVLMFYMCLWFCQLCDLLEKLFLLLTGHRNEEARFELRGTLQRIGAIIKELGRQ